MAKRTLHPLERAMIGEHHRPAEPIACCGNCRFWVRGKRIDPANEGAYIALERMSYGECHRRAPVGYPWPLAPEYEWCGEHEYPGEHNG